MKILQHNLYHVSLLQYLHIPIINRYTAAYWDTANFADKLPDIIIRGIEFLQLQETRVGINYLVSQRDQSPKFLIDKRCLRRVRADGGRPSCRLINSCQRTVVNKFRRTNTACLRLADFDSGARWYRKVHITSYNFIYPPLLPPGDSY